MSGKPADASCENRMLTAILRRLRWSLYGRLFMQRRVRGFIAAPLSYATCDSTFCEYAALRGTAQVFRSSIGRFSYVAGGRIVNTSVGAFSSIGPGVLIGGFGRHPTRWVTTHPAFYSTLGQTSMSFVETSKFDEFGCVVIGSDVWIGSRVMVLDGVCIGDGAIVGAGSIVVRDVKPYEVVAGAPARHLRFRFDDESIFQLQKSKWWQADVQTLRRLAPLFCESSPTSLLKALQSSDRPSASDSHG